VVNDHGTVQGADAARDLLGDDHREGSKVWGKMWGRGGDECGRIERALEPGRSHEPSAGSGRLPVVKEDLMALLTR